MTENAYYAEWGTVLTGLALGALTTGLSGFPTDRPHLERALAGAWPDWDGHTDYPHVLPRDYSFYAERGTLMQRDAPATWEWTHGIRPVLAAGPTDADEALIRFAASQPVGASAWQDLARRVTALLPAS
jgi:hypothetical protein